MSWTRKLVPYQTFAQVARDAPVAATRRQWTLTVWEVTDEFREGRWTAETNATFLKNRASLRIIFAPLDLPQHDTLPQALDLFSALGIPTAFTTERTQSASHSFGHNTDSDGGFCAWFHFLCKNIEVKEGHGGLPEVVTRTAAAGYARSTLPQADYSYHRSGFFLRAQREKDVVMVCFEASPRVRKRLEEFINIASWEDVAVNPYVLFDVVCEGLYFEVDGVVWNMNRVFGPLEHMILGYAHDKATRNLGSKIPFAALHNCAKHIIHLAEAVESCIMVVDAILLNMSSVMKQPPTAGDEYPPSSPRQRLVEQQLKETLRYRRSLFQSTQLRLTSLQKRIDNLVTLSFHLVTQQDSMVMTQDSTAMKMIAGITMVFLPTTGVATVVGSQLLVSEPGQDGEAWRVLVTPLFWVTWWIAVPLTVCVALFAMGWNWWVHGERRAADVVRGRVKAWGHKEG